MELKKFLEIKRTCIFCIETNSTSRCNKNGGYCTVNTCKLTEPSHPLVSTGKSKERLGYHKFKLNDLRGLSKTHMKVLKFRSQKPPLSYKTISKRINKSKSRAYQIHKEAEGYLNDVGLNDKHTPYTDDKPPSKRLNKKTHDTSLHNDLVKFQIEPLSFLFEKTVKLKFTEYKLVKSKLYHIQIFPNGSLIVRFKIELIAESVELVKNLADERIIYFLKTFKCDGVKFVKKDGSYIQLQRDYAILKTGFAETHHKEKEKLFVFDDDGSCRAKIDFSDKKNPHLEHPHADKGFKDATRSEKFVNDLLNKDSDIPSLTKTKLDSVTRAVERFAVSSTEYAENIKLHLSVMSEMSDTLKQIKKSLKFKK